MKNLESKLFLLIAFFIGTWGALFHAMQTGLIALGLIYNIVKYKDDFVKLRPSSKEGFKIYGITDIEKISIGAKYTITGVVRSERYFYILRDAKLQILLVFRKNNIKIGYQTNINIISNEDNISEKL